MVNLTKIKLLSIEQAGCARTTENSTDDENHGKYEAGDDESSDDEENDNY